jgi:hypothetical protein
MKTAVAIGVVWALVAAAAAATGLGAVMSPWAVVIVLASWALLFSRHLADERTLRLLRGERALLKAQLLDAQAILSVQRAAIGELSEHLVTRKPR